MPGSLRQTERGRMKKFWNWTCRKTQNQETDGESSERVLALNGTIEEESWFDDEVTPALFRDELNSSTGDITVRINSFGGYCMWITVRSLFLSTADKMRFFRQKGNNLRKCSEKYIS